MRIKLEIPEVKLFSTEIPVMIQHINYGNHLGNDSILSIIHEARIRFFSFLGGNEFNIGGSSVIMSDVAIVYKSEGHHADILLINIGLNDITAKSFDIYFEIINTTTNKPLAVVKTGMVGFNYNTSSVQGFHENFINELKKISKSY